MLKDCRQESKNKSNKTSRMKGRGTPAGCCHAHAAAHSKRLSACNFGQKKDTERCAAVFAVSKSEQPIIFVFVARCGANA